MRVMLKMIHPEPDRSRDKVGEISADCDEFIPTLSLENKVVGRVMNDDVHTMIQKRAQTEGDEQAQPAEIPAQPPHRKCNRCLRRQNQDHDCRGEWISPDQLPNFGMSAKNGARPLWMRLIKFRLIKRGLHLQRYVLGCDFLTQPRR